VAAVRRLSAPLTAESSPEGTFAMSDDSTTIAQLRQQVATFVAERHWERYHDAKNLSMAIAIEAAELMEHFQWVRNEELGELLRDSGQRGRIAEELADVLAFLLAFSHVTGIDLSSALAGKMARNAIKYPVETFRGRYFKPPSLDEPG
jgi:NTP pyrophosphatase (non-canonical NTP hydrolase)